MISRIFGYLFLTFIILLLALLVVTSFYIKPIEKSFRAVESTMIRPVILSREGIRLTSSYQEKWNIDEYVELQNIPAFLIDAFIAAEDKRFYEHEGIDWLARLRAVKQNIANGRVVSGASTITEQTVRMLHPRSRKFWSRWIEGFEAKKLEENATKEEILAFYLNQIPYASNRRGVSQAAKLYFDRDLDSLSKTEMLALAAMVRSPSRLDPRRNPKLLRDAMQRLAKNIGYEEKFEPFDLAARKAKNINISGAIRYIRDTHHANSNKINSTIDYSMQEFASNLLEQRLQKLKPQNAHHAAMLVVNHQTGQILAWVNAAVKEEGSAYDSVTVPRQPGSAMKPFVYAMALEKNWQAATQILDAPLSSAIGAGQHQYRNYSGKYYGLITMRQALGNSLNIPAVKAVQYVGLENYMQRLMNLGFTTLQHSADIYGDGIALGNAEVTLLELVQAYTVFPNNGRLRKLRIIQDIENAVDQVFSPEISYVISNILSDRNARGLEFGAHSVLNMPGQVAVKTGTSTDYRDAWTIAYNDRYIVGVWIGNLDQEPMDGVTGSTGPALVARSMMHELSKRSPAYIFNRPKSLQNASICKEPYRIKQYDEDCNSIDDIFIGNPTNAVLTYKTNLRADNWWIAHPTEGLKFAMDPRIPDELEMINFRIGGNIADNTKIIWQVNDQTYTSQNSSFKWPMQKGQFDLTATIDGVSYKRSFEVR